MTLAAIVPGFRNIDENINIHVQLLIYYMTPYVMHAWSVFSGVRCAPHSIYS